MQYLKHLKSDGLFIALLLMIVYAPFVNGRFVRTSGDDKVYTNQVVDMVKAGNWFVQKLGDQTQFNSSSPHTGFATYVPRRSVFLINAWLADLLLIMRQFA